MWPHTHVDWKRAYRIIASRYPPIDLFERVSRDPAVREALTALEMATNPRVRDEVGDISLVPPDRRISGPGASYVMASFTHVNPSGSRFSDGSRGVYYAGESFSTALAEVAHHFAERARDSGDGPRREDMRCLVGKIDHRFVDVGALEPEMRRRILDPVSYEASRTFAQTIRDDGADGVHYPSVRRPGGRCVGAFYPDVVGIPVQAQHIKIDYDGRAVSRYFDYQEEKWHPIQP